MSCQRCYQSLCRCSELDPLECACVDPGLETTGAHVMVLDSQFCQRRLTNAPGFLYQSSTGKTLFSTEPRVPLTQLEVNEGDKFGYMVISMGSNGVMRRVVPADGVDGVLKADGDGNWTIADISSSFAIPDPLTITTLNASTVNAADLNVTGNPVFSSLDTDTITQTIGLNASNQLVKGSTPTVSVASFFENNTLTGSGTPNYNGPSSASDNAFIGNEIADPDGIASVQDDRTIRIDAAGNYIVRWRGVFEGWNPLNTVFGDQMFFPGLWLTVNSVVVAYGAKAITQTRTIGGAVGGEYVALGLTVGTLLRLQLNGSVHTDAVGKRTGLSGVGMILEKIR